MSSMSQFSLSGLLAATVVFAFATAALGFNQTITFFESAGYWGNTITFTHKMPNTRDYQYVWSKIGGGCCVEGWWIGFSSEDYGGSSVRGIFTTGYQTTLPGLTSIRHLGPVDTATEALSLYYYAGCVGEEWIITYVSEPEAKFDAESMFVTGHSNWTFFEGTYFEGPSVCFESQEEVELVRNINFTEWGISKIGSVRKGCEDTCVSWKPTKRIHK